MVKDILGLRSEDDFSHLEHERLTAKCNEEMVIESQEDSAIEVNSCTTKGIQCVLRIIFIYEGKIKNMNYHI